jgi:membrane protein implicated in regulation of membrane protease activity
VPLIFWILIIVIAAASEIHTNALAGGFVAAGAVVALLVLIAGATFQWQALAWLLVTMAGVVGVRPFALKKFGKHQPGDLLAPTTSSMTGLRAVVIETVGTEQNPGRVTLRGETWRAVTTGPPIAVGEAVEVDKVMGTTLYVQSRPAD